MSFAPPSDPTGLHQCRNNLAGVLAVRPYCKNPTALPSLNRDQLGRVHDRQSRSLRDAFNSIGSTSNQKVPRHVYRCSLVQFWMYGFAIGSLHGRITPHSTTEYHARSFRLIYDWLTLPTRCPRESYQDHHSTCSPPPRSGTR